MQISATRVSDGSIARARETNQSIVARSAQFHADGADGFQVAHDVFEQFTTAAAGLEDLGWPTDRIRTALQPSRDVFATASLMGRCQTWPRGYAGDFETIEWLAGLENQNEPGTLGWYFDEVILNSPVAQQHRNKLECQTAAIAQCLLRKRDARVLSVACGGCLDWVPMLSCLSDFTGEIVLNDYEPEALSLASKRIGSATARFRCVPGNLLRVCRRLESGPQFDLVVAGGVFDYLSDQAIVVLIRSIYQRLLAPGGRLLFTNMAKGNAFRPLMEYGSNWNLIERTEQQMIELCMEAGVGRGDVRITRDATGLALLARVDRSARV